MSEIRELGIGETGLAYEVMLELRPDAGGLEDFVATIDEKQRDEGYRLVAAFGDDPARPVSVAGFRTGHDLGSGPHLYVDDLVTAAAARKQGHAAALMAWIVEEARRLGCDQVHLDSRTHRHDAHRFYLGNGFDIAAFHFVRDVSRRRS